MEHAVQGLDCYSAFPEFLLSRSFFSFSFVTTDVSPTVRITQNLFFKRMEELKTAIKNDQQSYK